MSNAINKSRRNFLRVGAAAGGAVALGALDTGITPLAARRAHAAPLANYKRLIVINMLGGNDGMNTLIPVTGSVAGHYLTERPTLAIQQGQGLPLTGGPGVSDYELHPSLPNLQAMWNAGDVAFVQKVGYPQQNLSHFVSEDIWSYGARSGLSSLSGLAPGWVARYGNLEAGNPMSLVSIGVGRRLDFAGANVNPFLVSSVASFDFDTDWHYSRNHELRLEVVQNILAMQDPNGLRGQVAAATEAAHIAAAQVQVEAANYSAYESANNIQYPLRPGSTTSLTNMGRRMRDIALLIYGGFDTRVFYTGYGGFDTHSGQAARHASLLQELDDALGVFRQDIGIQDAAGGNPNIWNNLAIVVISEFGRRNYENGSDGTDHGHGNCVIVAGGAVSNPGIHGDPLTDADITAQYLPYSTDFRDVYRNLIGDHMGSSNVAQIFPESQPVTTNVNVI